MNQKSGSMISSAAFTGEKLAESRDGEKLDSNPPSASLAAKVHLIFPSIFVLIERNKGARKKGG